MIAYKKNNWIYSQIIQVFPHTDGVESSDGVTGAMTESASLTCQCSGCVVVIIKRKTKADKGLYIHYSELYLHSSS